MTIGLAAQPAGARGVDRVDVVRRIRAAGVPVRFEDCRLETFHPRQGTRPAYDAAAALARDEEGRGLALFGAPGTGKTHLAVAVITGRVGGWLERYPDAVKEYVSGDPNAEPRVEVRPNLAIRFLVVPTFLDRLRAAARWTQYDDPLPELLEADLVVLDDLGREKVTDWASERLYVLVNERYNRCLPTIVTSNYQPGELVERGYEAILSRLADGAEFIRITADDYRRSGR